MYNITKRCVIRRISAYFSQRSNSSTSNQKIIRSKLPEVEIPNLRVEELVFKNLGKWENKVAVECASTGRKYSYLQIYKKSRALANFFHKYSTLKQNNTIAIILPNVPEYPIIILGAIQAGLRVTAINPLCTPDQMARQLEESETKLIFTLSELHSKINQAAYILQPQTFSTVVVNHTCNYTPSGALNFKNLTDEDHNLSFKIKKSNDDVLLLPYSSGTTNLPKGIEITNKNVVALLTLLRTPEFCYMYTEDEVVPALLPMFHIYGMLEITLNLLSRGSKLITMSTCDTQLFIDVLDKHRPTVLFLVPSLALSMINHPGITQEHLNQLKLIFSGSAPLGAKDVDHLRQKGKNNVSVLQGYGLTETCSIVCSQTEKLPNGVKFGGSGFCFRNTEVKVVSLDNQKKLLGPNESGELVVRGPQVMKGYLNNLKKTHEVLDSEGWLRTGDVGYYDEDEHIFITDRISELIQVQGFQISPSELEAILREIPDVQDAAVAGVFHETYGEVPKAFIIPKKGIVVNPEKIQKYVESRVTKHKRLLGGIAIVNNIPKTASGKIIRKAMR